MAGTTHYYFEVMDPHSDVWKVEINDNTYAGIAYVDLSGTTSGNGFNIAWKGADAELYTPIVGSDMDCQLDISADSTALLNAIIEGPENRFTVRVYKNTLLYWQGFILQDELSKPDAADNTDFISFAATDGFGLLKDIKYDGFNIDDLSRPNITYWISLIIGYLPASASLISFGFASVWYEDSQQSSVVPTPQAADPLANTFINQSVFLEVDKYGVAQAMSLYDILSAILSTHNLQISQCNGKFLLIQQNTYAQAQTRVWWYSIDGTYLATSIIDLQQTMPVRMSGGTYTYILPLKEIRAEYEYRQGIYKNNLLPNNVNPNVIYDLGLSTLDAGMTVNGIIEHYYEGSGGTPIEIQAVYKVQIRNGSYYLNLNATNSLEWNASALSYVPIYSTSLISVSIAEMLVVTKVDLILPPLPEEGGILSFTWSFWRYEVYGTKTLWTDIYNTHHETVDDREGSFVARINTGIVQEGTQLFRATVSNGAAADLELETSILGDGANKYSAGALFVNDTTPKIVESNVWTIYAEIGSTAYAINSMRVREMLALRRATIEIYNGTFDASPDFHKGFTWDGKYWVFTSINWDCNAGEYTFSAYAVVLDRTGINVDNPLTAQDTSNAGSSTSSSGSSTTTETHGRLHNLFSETDHSGTGGTEKATPVDADSVVVIDSADGSKVKRTTIAHLKTVLGAFWTRTGTILYPATAGDSIRTTGEIQGSSIIAVETADAVNQTGLQPGGLVAQSKYVQSDWRTYINTSEPPMGQELYKRLVQYFKSPTAYTQFQELITVVGTWTTSNRPVQWVIKTVVSGATTLSDRIKILGTGSFQIGNDTNNSTFDLDGKLRLNGSATVWDDLQTSGLSSKKGGANDPTFTVIAGAIWLDVFSGSATNEVFFTVQFPHKYKEGSDIEPHVHWFPMTSPATTKNVIWKLEYQWVNHDGTFSGVTNTTITGTGATGTVGYTGKITSLGVVSGAGKGISSLMICRLYREGANALDTYADGAAFTSIDMHYEIDSLGSDTEYAK